MHDVYSYGVIAPSTLVALDDEYPPAAGYAEIKTVVPSIGGEAAASTLVLARLGIATKLAGNRLGGGGEAALALLRKAGVDCTAIDLDEGTGGVTEIIMSQGDQRTIFGTYKRLLADRPWGEPSEEDIRTARIVNVDPFFGDESVTVSRLCRKYEKPYVTVDALPDSEIARSAAVVIVSHEFISQRLGDIDPLLVLSDYAGQCEGLVVLTQGSAGAWWRDGSQPASFHPAFSVEVRDTTGAGDAFRAGAVYGLLRGYTGEALVRVASAVAALVCQTTPGVLHSPTAAQLETFLAKPI